MPPALHDATVVEIRGSQAEAWQHGEADGIVETRGDRPRDLDDGWSSWWIPEMVQTRKRVAAVPGGIQKRMTNT